MMIRIKVFRNPMTATLHRFLIRHLVANFVKLVSKRTFHFKDIEMLYINLNLIVLPEIKMNLLLKSVNFFTCSQLFSKLFSNICLFLLIILLFDSCMFIFSKNLCLQFVSLKKNFLTEEINFKNNLCSLRSCTKITLVR